jgi:uroporphyrinogen-III synthase
MDRPLAGRSIVITRNENRAGGLIRRIEALGGKAIVFPTIEIRDPDSWQACDNAIRSIDAFDWVVFPSANAAYYFFQRSKKFEVGAVAPKIAAVGKKTADALRRLGRDVDLVPDEFTARGLLQAIANHDVKNKRILLPTSDIARDELNDGLRRLGAHVERVVIYKTAANRSINTDEMSRKIEEGEIDCVTFFSPSAFEYFVELVGEPVIENIKDNSVAIAAIGPTTAGAISARNLDVTIQPRRSLEEELVEALAVFYSSN